MKLIHRYLTSEVLRIFIIILTMVVGLVMVVDYLSNLDEFVESGIAGSRVLAFVLLKIPFMLVLIIPVGLLLSIQIVFGLMSKNNELAALKSGGVSIYFLIKPLIGLGVLLSITIFVLSNSLVPGTIRKANEIQRVEIRKHAAVATRAQNIWIKGDRSIAHIHYYHVLQKTAYGLTLSFFDAEFRLARRLDARQGVPHEGRWELTDVIEQIRSPETGKYKIRFHQRLFEPIHLETEDLNRVSRRSEEMSLKDLRDYIRKVEAEGYDATPYRVDFQAKIAFPFVSVIFCLLGIGIAARDKMRIGMPLSVSAGIASAFLYWILYSFCLSLGYGGWLPAVPAAWSANFIFLCAGLIVLQQAE